MRPSQQDERVVRTGKTKEVTCRTFMGLNGPELTAYVLAVHAADHHEPGDDGIAAKPTADRRRSGLHWHAVQVHPT